MHKRKKQTLFKRATALFLLLSFNIGSAPADYAYGQTPRGSDVPGAHSQAKSFSLANLDLPKGIGTLESFQDFHSPRTVILIQDAHAVGDAQKSIRELTDYLSVEHSVKLFALEGASAPLDVLFFRSFPKHTKLQEVFESYLQRGEISGAAAGAVLNKAPAHYAGVENQSLYESGINLFLQASDQMVPWSAQLLDFETRVNSLKKNIYSPELLELDARTKDFDSSRKTSEALHFFADKQRKEQINLSTYPHVEALFKQLDSGQQKKETAGQLKAFTEKIKRSPVGALEMAEINRRFQSYQTESHSAYDYAAFLAKVSSAHGIQTPKEILLMAESADILAQAKGGVIFEELRAFIRDLKIRFYKTEEAKMLDRMQEKLERLQNLTALKLSSKDWEFFVSGSRETLILQTDRKLSEEIDAAEKKLSESIFTRFYENAIARERALHQNLMDLMVKRGEKTAVLVVGGFHALGMMEQLRREKTSYALISPAIKNLEKETRYLDYMRGDVSWKNYFEAKDGRVSLYDAFARAVRDKLLFSGEKGLAKRWRDQILRDLAAEMNIAKAGAYTAFIDEAGKGLEPEKIKQQWLAKVENFIQGLERLQKEDRYNASGLSSLLKHTSPAAALQWNAIPSGTVPEAWLAGRPSEQTSGFFESEKTLPAGSVSRSEARKNKEPFLFGLHEANPDWWTMRVLGASLLTAQRVHKTDSVTLEQIKELAISRLEGAGLPPEDMTDAKLESLLLRIQDELKLIHKLDSNQWTVVPGAEKLLTTQMAAVDIVLDDLLEVLGRIAKGDDKAADHFYSMMQDYAAASEHWHLFETESRWAVEKAFELLLKKDQKILMDVLKKAPKKLKSRGLVDAVIRLIAKEVSPDWAKENTPNLVGGTIFYISPETWLAAGGLGRVGQYHTVKIKELMGNHAGVATIESYYWKPDPEHPGQFLPIDYSGVAVPVKDLRKETEFEIRVSKKGQRVKVTVEVFKGTNDKGIEVYMLRDKPEEGQAPYFVRQLYKYANRFANPNRDMAMRSEYIEFMSKASLKLVKKLNKKTRLEKEAAGQPYAPPVVWNNDGQSIPTSAFKRISDALENFTAEQKQLLLTSEQIDLDKLIEINPQAYEKVRNGLGENQNRIGWILEELKDLIRSEDEDSLVEAATHSTTHTYLNRGWEPFEELMREWAIPKAFNWLFDSVVYKGQADPSRALAAADTKNGVAAVHAQEMGPAHNPESTLSGIANGDHLEATQAHLIDAFNLVIQDHPELKDVDLDEPPVEFIPIIKEKSKELWIANLKKLLTAQIAAEKDKTKKDALENDLKVVEELSAQKATGSYSGRAQEEKVDLLEVFTLENLRQWASDGGQIVPYANVQANEGSEKLFAELKRRQNIVNEEARKPGNEHWGRVLIVTGWNQDEQKYLMAASDFSLYVSARDFKNEKWGTEAAGRTEANYALFYAMNITAPYIEGLFTVEGAIRDRNHPGQGNIILSPRHEEVYYRKTVSQVIADWKEAFIERKTLSSYAADLIAGRKMSLVLDAGMPGAQYARTFNEASGIKRDPVGAYLKAVAEETQEELESEIWFREDLIRVLRSGASKGREVTDHEDDKVRVFTAEVKGKPVIAAVASGMIQKNERRSSRITNTQTHALSELLISQMQLTERDHVRIKDFETGEDYGVHPVSALIGYGVYGVDINLSADKPIKLFSIEKVSPKQRNKFKVHSAGIVAKSKFSAEDGFRLFTPPANSERVRPFEFYRSLNAFIGTADAGLAGFIHSYHRFRREKPQEMIESIRHHAERGDILNYLLGVMDGQKQSGAAVFSELKKIQQAVAAETVADKKVMLNLIAMDLVDHYLRWMAGKMFEAYEASPSEKLYDPAKKPTELGARFQGVFYQTPFTKHVRQYLESSKSPAKKLPSSKQGIQNYLIGRDGNKLKVVSLNIGAVSYPDQGVDKAWGKIPYRGSFKQLVDALSQTPGAGWQISEAKSKKDFGFYLPGELESKGLSVGVPGLQLLELTQETDEALIHAETHRGNSSDWMRVKLVAEAIKRAAFERNSQRLEKLLPPQRKVAEKLYPPSLLPSLMGLIAGLVPEYLDKVKEWNPEAYAVLRKILDENQEIMKKGNLVFNDTGREEGVFNFSYSVNGFDDQNIVFHVELDHGQFSRTDKKSWTVVRLNNEGINLEDESLYRIHGLVEDLVFNPKTGKHLKRHWDTGAPVSEEVKDPESGKVIQHPWGFGVYRLERYRNNQFPTPPVAHPADVSHEVQKPEDLQVFEFNARAYFEEIGIKSFDDFTDERLQEISDMGFNALWVMGIYKLSKASEELNLRYEDPAHPGRRPSAFAVSDYSVNNEDLGGEEAYRRFVDRAKKKGIRVMADFIPNHVAKDSPLIAQHPDWFIHRTTPPAGNEAERFFRYSLPNGKLIWVAHGTDGGGPWADTAVFNLLNPEVWQFYKETLFKIADLTQGGGIRADSLQVLFPDKYRELWFRYMLPANFNDHMKTISQLVFNRDPDNGNNVFGALFANVKESYPDFKVIGEIYENQHGDWQRSGVDITYAKYVYNWIVNGEKLKVDGREIDGWQTFKNMVLGREEHQDMTLEYMLRSYYFLEDHDQRIRILEKLRQRLGKPQVDSDVIEWSKLLATAIATIPGVPQVYMGQQDGRSRIIDSPDWFPPKNWVAQHMDTKFDELPDFYRKLYSTTQAPIFRRGSRPEEIPHTGGNGGELVFVRRHEGKAGVVALNHSSNSVTVTLDLAMIGQGTVTKVLPPWGAFIQIMDDTVKPANRSEVRLAAVLILSSLISAAFNSGAENILNIPAAEAATVIREAAQDPKLIEAYGRSLNGQAEEKNLSQHPNYEKDLQVAVRRLAENTSAEAAAVLSVNPKAKLHYELALAVNDADARENILTYLQQLKQIDRLSAEYPQADIKVKVLLLTKGSLQKDPDWQAFAQSVDSLGVAERIDSENQAAVNMKLEQFLKDHPRALVYGLAPEDTGLSKELRARVVDSQINLNSQLPVAMKLTNGLAKTQILKADELREATLRLVPWGMVISSGEGLLITTDALGLIYQSYLAEVSISASA